MKKTKSKHNETITLTKEGADVMIVSKGIVIHRIYPNPTKSTIKRIQRLYRDSVHNPSASFLGLSDQNYTMIWRRRAPRRLK